MQYACAILSSVVCPTLPYFPPLSHKRYDFRKKKSYWTQNMCFDFCTNLCEKFLIIWRIERDSYKVPVILVILQWNLKFLGIFSKNTQISNFMKILPVGDEVFRADRRTEGQTDMPRLTVAFRNFANVPKICITRSHMLCAFHKILRLGGHVCRQICSRLPKRKSGHSKPRRALFLSLSFSLFLSNDYCSL